MESTYAHVGARPAVAAALLSVPAVASAETKGFVVKNDSGLTLKLTSVDRYGGTAGSTTALVIAPV